MAQILRQPNKGKALPSVPFRTLGAVPLGDGARLDVQIATSGGSQIVNLRNAMRGSGGMLPAGPGALFGADSIPAVIELLQRAVAPQAAA